MWTSSMVDQKWISNLLFQGKHLMWCTAFRCLELARVNNIVKVSCYCWLKTKEIAFRKALAESWFCSNEGRNEKSPFCLDKDKMDALFPSSSPLPAQCRVACWLDSSASLKPCPGLCVAGRSIPSFASRPSGSFGNIYHPDVTMGTFSSEEV